MLTNNTTSNILTDSSPLASPQFVSPPPSIRLTNNTTSNIFNVSSPFTSPTTAQPLEPEPIVISKYSTSLGLYSPSANANLAAYSPSGISCSTIASPI